jgi:hypothetical protein
MVMGVSVAITLTGAPLIVAGSNFTSQKGLVAETSGGARACQAGESLPEGTTAIRLSVYALIGPRLTIKVLSGKRLLASGVRDPGWIGESPTVALRPVSKGAQHVRVCFALGAAQGNVILYGGPAKPSERAVGEDGQLLSGRLRIEYLKPDDHSWLSLAPSVARRMGLGHWPAGTWIVLLELALMLGVLVGAIWLTNRELR